ncbi:MAG: carbohydrate deacetylase [Candidatus Acidiferrales bacterium]
MKRLIVNADDFGATRGVNEGIVRSHREGIVTSATIMANGNAFGDAAALAAANPGLGVGIHLVLVGGRATASPQAAGGLADKNGDLPKSLGSLIAKLSRGKVRQRHIENEFRAQVERVCASEILPSHLDTHKHAHIHPTVMKALARIAVEYRISRVRMPFEDIGSVLRRSRGGPAIVRRKIFSVVSRVTYPLFRQAVRRSQLHAPDHFFGFAATGRLASGALAQILEALPDGTSELVCHPGINDSDLEASGTRLTVQREVEMAALTDPSIKEMIAESGVHLISYRELN